jgi:hypothetical protein
MNGLKAAALLAIVSLTATAAEQEKAQPTTREELIDLCVKAREHDFECKEQFIDSMIALRVKHQPQMKKLAEQDLAAIKIQGIKEITQEGSGPIEPRRALCAEAHDDLKSRNSPLEKFVAVEKCAQIKDCSARMKCEMPLLEQLLFKGK